MVASNFNAVLPESNMGSDSFKRYDTAMALLEEMESEHDLTIARFKTILDTVHRESFNPFFGTFTMYANTFDLRNRVAYLYYLSDFSEAVRFDLMQELARGAQVVTLSDLVSEQTREQASARFRSVKNRGRTVISGICVAILLALAGVSLLILKKVRRRRRVCWYQGVKTPD